MPRSSRSCPFAACHTTWNTMPADGSVATGAHDGRRARRELIAIAQSAALGGQQTTTVPVAHGFPARERADAIGAWSAIAGVGIVVGPTLGGLLLAHFYWGSVFWVNVPLAAVALVAVITVVPNLPGRRNGSARLDTLGAVLSAAAMLAVIDAVIEGPNRGWTSATTLGELGIGAVLIAAFIYRELHIAHPLIDLRVFRHRAFSAASSAIGITFLALFGSLFALTQYLQLVHGYSALAAGVRALPFAAAVLLTAPISSRLVARLGIRLARERAGHVPAAAPRRGSVRGCLPGWRAGPSPGRDPAARGVRRPALGPAPKPPGLVR